MQLMVKKYMKSAIRLMIRVRYITSESEVSFPTPDELWERTLKEEIWSSKFDDISFE